MMRHWKARRLAVIPLLVLSALSGRTVARRSSADAAEHALVSEALTKLPLSFIANTGQSDAPVKFISRGPGYGLFLTAQEAVVVASRLAAPAVVRMQLRGSNPGPDVTGAGELPGKVNYFVGNDPEKWRTGVPTYARVQYTSVYPGIDMVYYGKGRQLEYDFVVAPGADPGAIRLGFEGNREMAIDETGDLVLEFDDGEFRLLKPVVYQSVGGKRQEVAGEYVLLDQNQVSVQLGDYDVREPLVIDPILSYSTYLGGGGDDFLAEGRGSAVDGSGNVYLTGSTESSNFPTANPFQAAVSTGFSLADAFVTKVNAAGSALVYSSYLGGGSSDRGNGIAVDSSGNAYLTGETNSTNFPLVNPIQGTKSDLTDAFVTKVNAGGSTLVYSSYLGGADNDYSYGIALDASANAYVAGVTLSQYFPTANAFQPASGGSADAFIAKITDTTGPALNVSPATLSFAASTGGGNPGSQTLSVTNSGGSAISWTASAGTTSGGNWLALSPPSGTTPATISVSANVAGLSVGTYNGTIEVASPAAGNSPRTVPVTLTVANTNPTPSINSLSPSSRAAASSGFTLTVSGSNFISGSVIQWNGSSRSTTFLSSTQLQAVIPASAVAAAGTAQVTVFNPAPGGGTSNSLTFTIAQGLTLTITTTSLPDGAAGEPYFEDLSASGGTAPYTWVIRSASQPGLGPNPFTLSSSGSLEGTPTVTGNYTFTIDVTDSASPVSTASRTVMLTIVPPPTISSLSLTSAIVGGPGFNLVVNGSGFTSSAVVQWNGSNRTTTFSSATQLRAAISSSDIAYLGTAEVTVVNANATSNAIEFTIVEAAEGSSRQFSIAPRGLASMTTTGASTSTTVGYASVEPDIGSAAPSGSVLFGLRQNGVLISETSVPTSRTIQGGRMYAEIGGSVKTGLAIANPGTQDAVISFYFTDSSGQQHLGSGTTTIPAGRQIAKFLNESPFSNFSSLQGTFTFTSSAPVAVIAIRGMTNQRGEFLITSLPVTPVGSGTAQPVVLAQFADGQGWATTLLLLNPADNEIAGTVQFLDGSGQARTLTVGGSTSNSFPYTIRARSSQKLMTSGTGPLQVGSMHIVPASGQASPVAMGVFAYTQNGITVSQAGVSLVQGSILHVYAEKAQGGAINSGIAIANTSSNATLATVQLLSPDGLTLGGATLQIPGRGQTAKYLDELFPWVTAPFQGVLRVSSSSGALSVMGLRLRINERGDVLTTASPAASEAAVPPTGPVYVPHLVDGGGFTSQFIFIAPAGGAVSATMRFFGQSGTSLGLN